MYFKAYLLNIDELCGVVGKGSQMQNIAGSIPSSEQMFVQFLDIYASSGGFLRMLTNILPSG